MLAKRTISQKDKSDQAKYIRQRRSTKTSVPRSLTYGMPLQYTCKLKYSEYADINVAAASTTNIRFAANGLYDPNITGVGHQPNPFDQLMLFYTKATVIGSKITLRPMRSVSAGVAVPVQYGIVRSSDGVAYVTLATPDDFNESPLTNQRLITANADAFTSGTNLPTDVQTCTYSMRKQYPNISISDGTMYNTIAANCTDLTYFECIFYNIYANDPSACVFQITIEYIATFFEHRVTTPS